MGTLAILLAGCATTHPSSQQVLQSADAAYRQHVARAKALLITRMDQAKKVIVQAGQAEVIDTTCKSLVADMPSPQIAVHHAETSVYPSARNSRTLPLGPSDARAAVLSYKADLELARRWLDATVNVSDWASSEIRDELSRPYQFRNNFRVQHLRLIANRMASVERGPTVWYRERIDSIAAGKFAERKTPVALAIHDVQLGDETVGEQFRGTCLTRTLVAPYVVPAQVLSPSFALLIYDGDTIVFYAGGGWNGRWSVGGDVRLPLDTHSNVLIAARGKVFVFTKPGPYTMRVIAQNGAGWNDVLDVYEQTFVVAEPDQL
jgi:hypothetical protein